jgi:hypothetical protein
MNATTAEGTRRSFLVDVFADQRRHPETAM